MAEQSMMPERKDFQAALYERFAQACREGLTELEVNAGELHRQAGGYPSSNHRMPVCCEVLRATMREGDEIVAEPPGQDGASLIVRYGVMR